MRISVGEDIFWISLQSNIGPLIEFLEVLESGFELVSQEVSVYFNPAVYLYL